MKSQLLRNQRGISLVEILVVLAVMGIVMASVYGFYISQSKTALLQEEVVEVQQNLRVAMDMITSDINKAGFLVPSGTNPLGAATATGITINTATATGKSALVSQNVTTTTPTTEFTVESADMVDKFDSGASGSIVRIIRPSNLGQPISATFKVSAKDRTDPSLTLTRDPAADFPAGISISKGDIIAVTSAGAGNPGTTNTIVYSLLDGNASATDSCPANMYCIQRVDTGGTAQVVAANIAANGLQFSYILDDNSETAAPASLSVIRAVRVTINGATTKSAAQLSEVAGANRERQLATVVSIKNRPAS